MSRLFSILAALLVFASVVEAKTKLPDWVKEAMKLPAPPRLENETPSCEIVWDEAHYEVLANGRIQKSVRYAIRILDLKDRWRARADASYYVSSDTRPKITAWTIHDDDDIYKYKKSEEEERSNSDYLTLETESRTVMVNGWNHTRKGDVFAYEYTLTESTIFTQYYWRFQSTAPVAYSSLTVSAPEGWRIENKYFYGEPVRTAGEGSVNWRATNVFSKTNEAYSPSSAAKLQHMIVIVRPPEGSRARFSNLSFETWRDLADFKAKVSDPMALPTNEIVAKAKELTQGTTTDWERIKAIGEFAQTINYEHVALKLGNGGGYTPRSASETFRTGYGDCKDKSTLLRALLKAVDIESYVVSLNATDNDYVDASLPGPFYFNHCIAAVEVDESVFAPAVFEDDQLGRLLFIDPTWSNSPIGEIPFEAQGGLVVVGKRNVEPLVHLPLTSPEDNKTHREIVMEILPNGTILGRAESILNGNAAVIERRKVNSLNEKEYLEDLNRRYAEGGNPSPNVVVIEKIDNAKGDRTFRSKIDFAYRGYAKRMRDVLIIVKPAILQRTVDNPFSKKERKLPVRLRSSMLEESVTIYTPVGYKTDEYKANIDIETDFGSYHATLVEGEGEMKYTRTFVVQDTLLPVERYDELRDFYSRVVEAEQTPIVFAKL